MERPQQDYSRKGKYTSVKTKIKDKKVFKINKQLFLSEIYFCDEMLGSHRRRGGTGSRGDRGGRVPAL